jgi:5-oxoprolinase (ATP-hydrolysing)
VGPVSAGADTGPACYRRGGPLTITDANLLLGRLPQGALPSLFGSGGNLPPDPEAARAGFLALATASATAQVPASPETLAQGARTIALERMADAIRRISIQRGHDIRTAVLVSYGGAGGQHACALAERLGIGQVLLHPLAGVLSAYGIGLMCQEVLRQEAVQRPLEPGLLNDLLQRRANLLAQADQALQRSGDGGGDRQTLRGSLELRPAASDRGLEVPWRGSETVAELQAAYGALHQRRYGHGLEGEALVVERLQLRMAATGAQRPSTGQAPAGLHLPARGPAPRAEPPPPAAFVPLCLPVAAAGANEGTLAWRQVPCWRREGLAPGQRLEGPALVLESTGTTVLEPGWGGRVLNDGALLLEPLGAPATPAPVARNRGLDPVRLELYNHRFSAIAEQMGVRLQQSSRSVNIRERLDFSCALFDRAGQLVANAPHIPVHLGSMGESVVALLAAIARGEQPPLAPGDAVATNDPYAGGTHLPDITVITPVFAPHAPGAPDSGPPRTASKPLAYVASRGHHADVGGTTPGSMPPHSRTILEEGLLLRNVPLIQAGRFDHRAWMERLTAGPWPVRDPDRLLADLQAQVAANRLGEAELRRLINQRGVEEVGAYMGHVQANAAEAVRQVIDRLHGGSHAVELDDGSRIVVAIRPDHQRRRVTVDFSGTSPQQPGNLNAPLAITKAVVLYAFRLLVARPIPLNAGCFEPIDLVVPPGCMLHPALPAAVVGGNVETSQAVANALLAALGVMAASQGTMNNLSFGNAHHQYYETVAGGAGAGLLADGSGFEGCSAVQSHMTNSRLTDPEILEARYPVRLERFAQRRGSGGVGRWRGGDGVVRVLRFLEPMTLAILSGSRRVPPFGMAGGGDGQCGHNRVERADGRRLDLGGSAEVAMAAGDAFILETPGGGSWGA